MTVNSKLKYFKGDNKHLRRSIKVGLGPHATEVDLHVLLSVAAKAQTWLEWTLQAMEFNKHKSFFNDLDKVQQWLEGLGLVL